ncbi:uncharacterized protein [Palaemon carinicauda]|uniref:uncharacterized protein n=1 Tax=Palaemon carinicauda TaxID=392227 RepID=UPI0035B5E282
MKMQAATAAAELEERKAAAAERAATAAAEVEDRKAAAAERAATAAAELEERKAAAAERTAAAAASLERIKVETAAEAAATALEQQEKESEQKNKALRVRLQIEREAATVTERDLAFIRLKEKEEGKLIPEPFDVAKVQKLLPTFEEREPDNYFSVFEDTAKNLNWPQDKWYLIIRNSFKGKALSVCATMLEEHDYFIIKQAILDAYSITAEGYRQIFRNSQKQVQQTFLEFMNGKIKQFQKWVDKVDVKTFEQLKDLIVMEEFLRKIPGSINVYLREQNESDPKKAALKADDYALIHKVGKTPYRETRPKENCTYCKQEGHHISECPDPHCAASYLKRKPNPPQFSPKQMNLPKQEPKPKVEKKKTFHCASHESQAFAPFTCSGKINGKPVTILRDTGSSQTIVSPKVIRPKGETHRYVAVNDLTSKSMLPLINVNLHCPYFSGTTDVAVNSELLPCKNVDVILGNDIANSVVLTNLIAVSPGEVVQEECLAVTRSSKKDTPTESSSNPLPVSEPMDFNELMSTYKIQPDSFSYQQRKDVTLQQCFNQVKPKDTNKCSYFYINNDVLMRKFRSSKNSHLETWKDLFQIVVPKDIRPLILELSHSADSHLGITKTYERISQDFYWPNMKNDIKEYVKTCTTCQKVSSPNVKVPVAPLKPILVPKEPFSKIIVDCVGPLPKTKRGHEYLLTALCPTTRYPFAVPLRNISAKNILKSLVSIFTVVGFPTELQCDQGTNFMSHAFKTAMKDYHITQVSSSAYHPQTNGALERTHQTIKNLLRKYIHSSGNEWDCDLELIMYIIRGVRNQSTGMSPFELLFGRRPRTILSSVKERILKLGDNEVPLSQYISELNKKLSDLHSIAKTNLITAQEKMKINYDKKAKTRSFKVGDAVLLYHPIAGSPLREKYQGPYTITQRISPTNYIIATPDKRKSTQLVHINLLKAYLSPSTAENKTVMITSAIPYIDCPMDQFTDDPITASWQDSQNSKILENLSDYLKPLSASKCKSLVALFHEFPSITSDKPGRCTMLDHDIKLQPGAAPIKQAFYRTSQKKLGIMKEEVNYLVREGLAEPSASPWASPCLLVGKKNGKFRLCTDYRKINNLTIKDSYPLPRIQDIIDQVSNSTYLTQIDLLKGYYQIKLTETAKEISSFITPFGLFSYNVMPFGLANAPATFQRVMSLILQDLEKVFVYLDDIIIASDTWINHIQKIKEVFSRLKEHGLTINLAKSNFCKGQVSYLGHRVGSGKVLPHDANISAITSYPVPTTKQELKRFLGMVGYYSKFSPNFSPFTGPLFALTSSKVNFSGSQQHDQIFNQLKTYLSSPPILMAPNLTKPFYLQTDASDLGYGGILLQHPAPITAITGNLPPLADLLPVSYSSGRFMGSQLNWPTVEKELFAIVATIQRYEIYVDGQDTIYVYSDHSPLSHLHRSTTLNPKLLRWSYILSAHNIQVIAISGRENIVADSLSRITSVDPREMEKNKNKGGL